MRASVGLERAPFDASVRRTAWTPFNLLASPLRRLDSIVCQSIERQGCSILIVGHAREIISGIDVSCPAEEEFLERL